MQFFSFYKLLNYLYYQESIKHWDVNLTFGCVNLKVLSKKLVSQLVYDKLQIKLIYIMYNSCLLYNQEIFRIFSRNIFTKVILRCFTYRATISNAQLIYLIKAVYICSKSDRRLVYPHFYIKKSNFPGFLIYCFGEIRNTLAELALASTSLDLSQKMHDSRISQYSNNFSNKRCHVHEGKNSCGYKHVHVLFAGMDLIVVRVKITTVEIAPIMDHQTSGHNVQ